MRVFLTNFSDLLSTCLIADWFCDTYALKMIAFFQNSENQQNGSVVPEFAGAKCANLLL
jgi:hypothetical protein